MTTVERLVIAAALAIVAAMVWLAVTTPEPTVRLHVDMTPTPGTVRDCYQEVCP